MNTDLSRKTDRRLKPKKQRTAWQDELLSEGIKALEHGDYQRIADYTIGPNGKPYTSDYVRKVLLGVRDNEEILYMANRFLQWKMKLDAAMKKAAKKLIEVRK